MNINQINSFTYTINEEGSKDGEKDIVLKIVGDALVCQDVDMTFEDWLLQNFPSNYPFPK